MRDLRNLALLAFLAVATGCSWFGDDDEPEEIQPNPLPAIQEEVTLQVIWSQKIGKGADDRAVKLIPTVVDTRVFAAAPDGTVKALTTDTGREIWSRKKIGRAHV